MLWGWVQLDLAPPHNEIDPNMCAGNAGDYGGVNAPCSLFARYMLGGILEVRPFGRGPLRRFMVYGAPNFLFGKTIPQTLYTWSPDAIGVEHSWGAGIYIGKGFEFRVTQHFLFDRFGARDRNLGTADLGSQRSVGTIHDGGSAQDVRHAPLVASLRCQGPTQSPAPTAAATAGRPTPREPRIAPSTISGAAKIKTIQPGPPMLVTSPPTSAPGSR